jgi:hypothetical protein
VLDAAPSRSGAIKSWGTTYHHLCPALKLHGRRQTLTSRRRVPKCRLMARLPTDKYTFPWGDAEACPCGSGASFVRCCKVGPNQLPYVRIPNLSPPGPITSFAHPKCYMSPTNNCSDGKSREHYISEAILARFDKLNVSGMPWQAKGEVKTYPSKSMAANILCERHNNALSPLDTLGLRAFDAITEAADYAVNRKGAGRAQHYLISGEGLELWMGKLAAGIHFGGIAAADGGILRDTCAFPTDELIGALTTGVLPPNAHLWVSQVPGLVQRAQIGVGPLIDVEANLNAGVQVQFGPLRFETTLVTPPISAQHFSALAHRRRPRVIDFVGPARDARVVLSWRGGLTYTVNRLGVGLSPDTDGF